MIKQLIFLLGWENFTHGLHIYFAKHAWGNTDLPDFIGALQQGQEEKVANEADRIDLFKWADVWLKTKGPNKISLVYENNGGKVKNAKIVQAFCKYGEEHFRW